MKKPTLTQAILMLIVAIIITITFAACNNDKHDWNTFDHTVTQGETLWDLAKRYCPEDMSCQEYIAEVRELNNLDTDVLYAGQTIILLTTETEMINMYDVVSIEENDGIFTIQLSDGNYYEWYKGEF